MKLRYVLSGYADVDEDSPPYPDLAALKGDSQKIRDAVMALVHSGNGVQAVTTKRSYKSLGEIEQAALDIANAIALVRSYWSERR